MTTEYVARETDFLENNSDAKRKLAYVSVVSKLEPIDGADNILCATIENRNVVVKKGELEVGDECVYIESDTIVPERPEFEFLRSRNFKVKIAKIRGVYSEGLALPISIFSNEEMMKMMNYEEGGIPFGVGYDLTDRINVVKIPEKAINYNGGGAIFGKPKGNFPPFLRKTDETSLYALKPQKLLEKHKGKTVRGLEKLDGSSSSFYYRNGEFGVCSRNLEIKEDEKGAFWEVAIRKNLKEHMVELGRNLGVQAELIGPGIQGNKYDLKQTDIYVHNIFDIDKGWHVDAEEMDTIAEILGLNVCPTVHDFFELEHTYDQLMEMSENKSLVNPNVLAEGVVYRPRNEEYCDLIRDRLSFKIISRKWKDKYK